MKFVTRSSLNRKTSYSVDILYIKTGHTSNVKKTLFKYVDSYDHSPLLVFLIYMPTKGQCKNDIVLSSKHN
jgi:hypothetical protein